MIILLGKHEVRQGPRLIMCIKNYRTEANGDIIYTITYVRLCLTGSQLISFPFRYHF